MKPRLLVVEDEPELAEPLQYWLEGQGFVCEVVGTGSAALARIRASAPDAVLLDLMLPDLSGVEVCRQLRADPRTADLPVVMVTARADEYDKVVGFEAGADDYITKPYSLREVTLRVKALLRRTRVAPEAADLSFGALSVELEAHVATWQGQPLDLTVVEFRMLRTFLESRGRAMTREEICLGTWGERYAISERAVDTNVKRLRRKLLGAGDYLETVRGVGYRWSAEP
jgi:two-component system phosphate regulon response regulator PhoB